MSRALRVLTTAALAVALCAAAVGSVSAKPSPPGPGNSKNAKQCQKGGWQSLARSDGTTFANQAQCVSYAAKGGVLQPKPQGGGVVPDGAVNVCRYTGTPGVDEVLQVANSPAEVPVSSIVASPNDPPFVVLHDPVQVGDVYTEGQGFAVVVAVAGDPRATIEDCPGYQPPS